MSRSRCPSVTRSSRSHQSSSKSSATTSSSLHMRSTEPSTPIRPRKRNLQEGQAIVLIALLILVLFGMLGLAVDSGRGYVDRRDQQTAVDAAALAAGDWYENLQDLNGTVVPSPVAPYESYLRSYPGTPTSNQPLAL